MSEAAVRAAGRAAREVNREIQEALVSGDSVVVTDTRSAHNLGVGLPPGGGSVRFEGSVGYYCGGLNTGTDVHVTGNAGWGVGESMRAGKVVVDGYAGMSAGATMCGGLIHVRGDAGPRCGVGMKGGDIIVEGSLGFQSGFMAHTGRLIALGGAGDACADSLWAGEVWVAGPIKSLGVDTKVTEPTPEEVDGIDALLSSHGIAKASRDWKRIVSAQTLWYFESREAGAWLMI